MFIRSVIEAFVRDEIPYAIAGGYAVALHGAVRGTVDLDLIISVDGTMLAKAEAALHSLGLQSRIPVTAKEIAQFRNEFIAERNLKAWTFVNPQLPIEIVDILILYDLRDFKTVTKQTVFGSVEVLALEDLIRIKREAGRPQDLVDVEALKSMVSRA